MQFNNFLMFYIYGETNKEIKLRNRVTTDVVEKHFGRRPYGTCTYFNA